MKNVSKRGIFLVSIFLICTIAVLWRRFGASITKNPEQQSVRDSLYQQKRVLLYNTKVYSKAVRLADNGDIVVRLGADLTSELLRNMNGKDRTYSHAGIICREHDTVFVYHALGGEFNPDQQLLREPLWTFGHPGGNKKLALYRIRMDSNASRKLTTIIQQVYQQRIPFDTAFSLATQNRLYCTEFVALCFEKALQDTTLFHRSTAGDKRYIGVDDLTGSKQARKVESWAY